MDKLKIPAPNFYNGTRVFNRLKDKNYDLHGNMLQMAACRAKQIKEAIQNSYLRRTYSDAYLKRDTEKRLMYLSDFEQLGPRWVKECQDVDTHIQHNGWYTGEDYDQTLTGVVLCMSRHGTGENEEYFGEGRGKRDIYMAGTRHSDWDGVTLSLRTTDDIEEAARWADSMAEDEAESCREEDAKYRAEQQAEDLRSQIADARAKCLKLLRDMRPLRKGLMAFPETVCQALRDQVQAYCEEIAGYRNELKELT